jgi:hypothetical protein
MYKVATAIAEGTEEALFNEMPQQIVGNLVKQYVYKPNQDIFEGTAYAGGVGGVSGVITSIFTQMIAGKKARAMEKKGDQGGSEETDIETQADEMADKLAPDAASDLAQKMVSVSSDIDNLKEEIANDEMGLQAFEEGSQERQNAELVLNEKKSSLDRLQKEFDSLSATPVEKAAPVAEAATPSTTIEEAKSKVEQLNTEFDALDENDQAGIDKGSNHKGQLQPVRWDYLHLAEQQRRHVHGCWLVSSTQIVRYSRHSCLLQTRWSAGYQSSARGRKSSRTPSERVLQTMQGS